MSTAITTTTTAAAAAAAAAAVVVLFHLFHQFVCFSLVRSFSFACCVMIRSYIEWCFWKNLILLSLCSPLHYTHTQRHTHTHAHTSRYRVALAVAYSLFAYFIMYIYMHSGNVLAHMHSHPQRLQYVYLSTNTCPYWHSHKRCNSVTSLSGC